MTRTIALLGHPVAHSISPRFQQAALDALPATPANAALISKIQPAVSRYLDIGIRIERIMYLDGYAATIEMLRKSDWSTVTAWSVVYSELENGSIKIHPLVGTDLSYHLCLVQSRGASLSLT